MNPASPAPRHGGDPVRLQLTSLRVYPVKSCRGTSLSEAVLTARGLPFDREWMLVRPDGRFVTQREEPRLALVVPFIGDGLLRCTAPDRAPLEVRVEVRDQPLREVTVWKHSCRALDEGDGAAAWFSGFLGSPVRLVRFDPRHRRLSDAAWAGAVEAENAFSDGFPLLLIAEESLADLNARIGGDPLPMDRFRPNLVVAGGGPYVEDRMRVLRSAGIELRIVKPCTRCRITTTDQASAEVGVEPLRTLATCRRDERLGGVVFGQNVVIAAGVGGRLQVGTTWEAAEA